MTLFESSGRLATKSLNCDNVVSVLVIIMIGVGLAVATQVVEELVEDDTDEVVVVLIVLVVVGLVGWVPPPFLVNKSKSPAITKTIRRQSLLAA